jgi:predicted component of type VI protein secretion system
MPDPRPLTDAALAAAVRKAVEVGLLPMTGFMDENAKNWERIRAVVRAALDAMEG